MKLHVGEAITYQDIDSGESRIEVPYQIVTDDDVLLSEVRETFPLGTSATAIKEALARALDVYRDDTARYLATKNFQEQLDQSTVIAEEISHVTIE